MICGVNDFRKGGRLRGIKAEYQSVLKMMQDAGTSAKETLKESGYDHVIYGTEVFSEDGELKEVNILCLPVTDEYFRKKVVTMKNVYVYAVHA